MGVLTRLRLWAPTPASSYLRQRAKEKNRNLRAEPYFPYRKSRKPRSPRTGLNKATLELPTQTRGPKGKKEREANADRDGFLGEPPKCRITNG
jgi:hypothetical protein